MNQTEQQQKLVNYKIHNNNSLMCAKISLYSLYAHALMELRKKNDIKNI